jgi:hypothetical protein
MNIEEIHSRFIAGQRLVDIALDLGLTRNIVEYQIKKHRKLDPDKWPKRWESTSSNSNKDAYIQSFHVYKCPDCILVFAVEEDYENQSDICCPVCWTENIKDLCSGGMKLEGGEEK